MTFKPEGGRCCAPLVNVPSDVSFQVASERPSIGSFTDETYARDDEQCGVALVFLMEAHFIPRHQDRIRMVARCPFDLYPQCLGMFRGLEIIGTIGGSIGRNVAFRSEPLSRVVV